MKHLIFEKITIQNFMRFGEKKTSVQLNEIDGLTLVTGKNGHGKSTIFDALSYVLTNKPLRKTAVGKMVNNVNSRGLVVSLDLIKDDKRIRITRGQKPALCKLYIKPDGSDEEIEQEKFDYTRDSTAETSKDIVKLLGFDSDLFRCMVINSTRTPTFFQSDSSTQKGIMENLFGFDILTEKASSIKVKKDQLKLEYEKKKSILEERVAAAARTKARIESVEAKITSWEDDRSNSIDELETNIKTITDKDPETASAIFEKLDELQSDLDELNSEHKRLTSEIRHKNSELDRLINEKDVLEKEAKEFDSLADEKAKLEANQTIEEDIKKLKEEETELQNEKRNVLKDISNITKQLKEMEGDECPTCGQDWPDVSVRKEKRKQIETDKSSLDTKVEELDNLISEMGETLSELKGSILTTAYSSMSEIERVTERKEKFSTLVDDNEKNISTCSSEISKLEKELSGIEEAREELTSNINESKPDNYSSSSEVVRDIERLKSSKKEFDKLMKEENPHTAVLEELKEDIPDEVQGEKEVRDLESLIDHHQYIERLLTRKDSPVRRRVTLKYLPILNNRMNSFLARLNLPYTVEFNDELLPEVFDFDSEIDPGALSGGEEERLVMALNWAFRECWEEIHGRHLSFVAIDERLDSGLDGEGAEASMEILREMSLENGRNVWVITHRNEFDDYAQKKIIIHREGKFSTILA